MKTIKIVHEGKLDTQHLQFGSVIGLGGMAAASIWIATGMPWSVLGMTIGISVAVSVCVFGTASLYDDLNS